jgi:hypothetical protein
LIALHVSRRFNAPRGESTGPVGLLLLGVLSALVLVLPITEEFAYYGQWAVAATWALIGLIVIRVLLERRIDWTAALIAFVAWMVSLSWGYDVPNLVAGTVILALLGGIWRGTRVEGAALRAGAATLALLATAVTGIAFLGQREEHPYYDRPKPELTARLDGVSPEFGRIRTNVVTATYLEDLASCVDRHPARRVAVLPDNPGIYPALGLRNPFPIDWMYPNEVEKEERRILEVARALERDGDYLVLFQTFSAYRLFQFDDVGEVPASSEPYFHKNELGPRILETLKGTRVTCGWFVGFYRPA